MNLDLVLNALATGLVVFGTPCLLTFLAVVGLDNHYSNKYGK